mgnify:CR=1 FL=1
MQNEFAKEIGPSGKRKERDEKNIPLPKAPDRRRKLIEPVP